ncbi:MAG TPA: hypothetical protein VFH54_15865 [Mycobacteriales bacterium]|nr:hypothetical protein [Mycobacteriales bacterium]
MTASLASAGVAYAGHGTGITAVPSGSGSWGDCTGTFVRSASGIVNETSRVCGVADSDDLTTFGAPVYVQFRPQNGTPDSACDPDGLIQLVVYPGNTDGSLSKWFLAGTTYNACFYYVNPQLVTGSVEAAAQTPTTTSLAWAGRYRIDVSGTWNNTSHGAVDAQYNNGDDPTFSNWSFDQEGWPGLGAEWGRLLVNGQAVDWGAFNPSHTYSWSTASGTSSIQLNVFDGTADDSVVPPTLTPNPSWYTDNRGSLSYTITYLGQ